MGSEPLLRVSGGVKEGSCLNVVSDSAVLTSARSLVHHAAPNQRRVVTQPGDVWLLLAMAVPAGQLRAEVVERSVIINAMRYTCVRPSYYTSVIKAG